MKVILEHFFYALTMTIFIGFSTIIIVSALWEVL